MGQPINLPIAQGSYPSESRVIADLQAINCYPNIVQNQGLSQETVFGTPGIITLTSTGIIKQVNRGSHEKNEIAYVVNGDKLYRVDRTVVEDEDDVFSNTSLGTVTGSGRVEMADNGTQLIILVPGGDGFIYNENAGTPFEKITDLDFPANGNPETVRFIDGYFVFTTDAKRVMSSALNDGLNYNALDFASAERDPDKITGQVIHNNQQFVIGTQSTEPFSNQGAATGYPLTRQQGYSFDKGSRSPFTIIKTGDSFMMIGSGENESPAMWEFIGNGYKKISNTAIEHLLQTASDTQIAEAFAFYYSQKGAYFACFTVGRRTFCYDLVTQRWHERSSFIDEQNERFRVNSIITAYGRLLVADSIDGRIGELNVDHYFEYDEEIRRIVTTANFSNSTRSIRVSSIEITIESGVGNDDRPDPQIGLSFSDDGGASFSFELSRSMGKIGEYRARQIWNKQGRAPRFRMYKITMSDPVKFVLILLTANIA